MGKGAGKGDGPRVPRAAKAPLAPRVPSVPPPPRSSSPSSSPSSSASSASSSSSSSAGSSAPSPTPSPRHAPFESLGNGPEGATEPFSRNDVTDVTSVTEITAAPRPGAASSAPTTSAATHGPPAPSAPAPPQAPAPPATAATDPARASLPTVADVLPPIGVVAAGGSPADATLADAAPPPPAIVEAAAARAPVHTPSSPPAILDPSVLPAAFGPLGSAPASAPRPSRPPNNRRAFGLGAGWPFVPLAPLVVVIVGLAVALGIGLVGLDHLERAGDDQAGARAELLAATVAARLSQLPPDRRLEATELAARRSPGAELLVVTGPTNAPRIVHDVTLGAPDASALSRMLVARRGVAQMRLGRARFAVMPIEQAAEARSPSSPGPSTGPRVVAMVPEPPSSAGAPGLVTSLLALVTLLLGVAATVAYAVSRDVTRDVEFVTRRVRGMAQVRTEPTGELIPARTMDEVGFLTSAFNKLVGRFGKAERAYRGDLARASAADRERAAFLAAVSHELRSPLNAILGFADILMEEVDGPLSPAAREEVEQIRGSGAHLLALINDILEFSALESGQLKLSRARVDLVALANEVAREARGLIGRRPIALRVEAMEPVMARVDGRRVRQVLGNLVNNAVKFTQAGEVVVRIFREGSMAAVSVTDTGPGISPQERALIFQEYKQARGERQRRRGTGLGLAIARRLVLLHHGSIQLDSELGRGSTFKVLLPIGNVDAAPSIRPPSRAPALAAPRRTS